MRNMSNAVKAFPDSLAEGMNKVTDNMGRMSERLGQDLKQSILKVKALAHKRSSARFQTQFTQFSLFATLHRCPHSSPSPTSTLNTVASLLSSMTT